MASDWAEDGLDPVLTPPEWAERGDRLVRRLQRAVAEQTQPAAGGRCVAAVVLVVGAKGFGKSTFLRRLAQRLTTQTPTAEVVICDTDLGQPLVGVPGIVSLRANGARQPGYAIFVGDNNPAGHPVTYMDACKDVLGHFFNSPPENGQQRTILLVNTHGWVSGLGAQLVSAIGHWAQVTHVVRLLGASGRKDEVLLDNCPSLVKETQIPAVSARPANAAEDRFVRFAKYFRVRSLARLEALPPIRVAASAIRLVAGVEPSEAPNRLTSGIELDDIASLNGTFVGICRQDESTRQFRFFGLAIVRSVDTTTGDLFLLTPMSPAALAASGADTLVRACIPVPLARWQQNDLTTARGAADKPFFIPSDFAVQIARDPNLNRKNLKRPHLLR